MLIREGWAEGCGRDAKRAVARLARLPIPKLCPEGFVFLWAEKHQIADMARASPSTAESHGPADVRLTSELQEFLENPPVTTDSDFRTQDVRWSDAVGSYLCGFIYYASLVEMAKYKGATGRDVVFLHVPSLNSDAQVQAGVDVTVALIQSLVETWRAKKGLNNK